VVALFNLELVVGMTLAVRSVFTRKGNTRTRPGLRSRIEISPQGANNNDFFGLCRGARCLLDFLLD